MANVRTLTIDGVTYDLQDNVSGYVTTDESVKQLSANAPSYSYWRPLPVGDSSSSTEGFIPTTKTGSTYTFPTLQAQPSTGTIRMGRASFYSGSYTHKLSPTTLTENRTATLPNKSGTIAFTDDIPSLVTDLGNIDPSEYEDDRDTFLNTLLDDGAYRFVWEDGDDFEYYVVVESLLDYGFVYQKYWYSEEGSTIVYHCSLTVEDGEVVERSEDNYMTTNEASNMFAIKSHTHYESKNAAMSVLDWCDSNALTFDNAKPFILYTDTLNDKNWLIERYATVRQPNYRYIKVHDMSDASHFYIRSGSLVGNTTTWGSWKEYPSNGVTDVLVNNSSVVSNGVAQIDLSNKIDTAGTGLVKTGTTLKTKLNSETSMGTIGTTEKLYPVGVDSNGQLCTSVPWDMGYECLYTLDDYIINEETITTQTDEYSSYAEGNTTVENYTADNLPAIIRVTFDDGNTSKVVYCNGNLYGNYGIYGGYDDKEATVVFSEYYPFVIFFEYSSSDDLLEISLGTEEEGDYTITIAPILENSVNMTACFESAVQEIVRTHGELLIVHIKDNPDYVSAEVTPNEPQYIKDKDVDEIFDVLLNNGYAIVEYNDEYYIFNEERIGSAKHLILRRHYIFTNIRDGLEKTFIIEDEDIIYREFDYPLVPSGGSSGQVLSKNSGTDYDLAWTTMPTIPTNVSAFTNDTGYITTETDPTVPAWAKASTKPSYNFSEIGSTPTTISGYGLTDAYTKTEVDNLLLALPEPMLFKGSLGTGGTITSLPAAAASNEGFVYKVITDGTYASQAAKVGDTFISDGSAWVLIPSGDEPSGTVTSVGLSNDTNGGLSVSGSPITSSGTISIGHSNVLASAQTTSGIYPIKIDKNGHISEYGSAVIIPTKTSDLTNDSGFVTTDEKVKQNVTTANNTRTVLLGPNAYNSSTTTGETYTSDELVFNPNTLKLTIGSTYQTALDVRCRYLESFYSPSSTVKLQFPTTAPSTSRVITLPDATGTVALTSDIPTVPTITLNGSSTTSPSFYAPTTAGTDGYYLKSNGSGAPTWASIPAENMIVNVTNGQNEGEYIADKTYAEIVAALSAGKNVTCVYDDNHHLNDIYDASDDSGIIKFSGLTNLNDVYIITFWDDDAIDFDSYTVPSITLNGSATVWNPSFYAPTSAGTSGYVLTSSGSGAPTWSNDFVPKLSQSSYSDFRINNDPGYGGGLYIQAQDRTDDTGIRFKVGDVSSFWSYYDTTASNWVNCISVTNEGVTTIKGLVAPTNDSDAATKKYVDDSIPTVPTITLNGSTTTSPSFYAPTTAGTNGYVLQSNGSGEPSWVTATLTDTEVTVAENTKATKYYPILATGVGTATRQIDTNDQVDTSATAVGLWYQNGILGTPGLQIGDIDYSITTSQYDTLDALLDSL